MRPRLFVDSETNVVYQAFNASFIKPAGSLKHIPDGDDYYVVYWDYPNSFGYYVRKKKEFDFRFKPFTSDMHGKVTYKAKP